VTYKIADTFVMTVRNDPPENPQDARKATAGQRELQQELDRQSDDPDAPGGHLSRKQVADET